MRVSAGGGVNIDGSAMIFKNIVEEIDGIIERDPAARSRWEVALCYPSFHAMRLHRLAHALWQGNWRILARWVSQVSRFLTGIEIHPGARIGRRFFVDHGMGVVIGETAEIGDNVTLYQSVTLGGTSPAVDSRAQVGVKRHPTLLDDVIVGSGAQILGPITVGIGARIGGNAVVVQDVAPGTTMVGIPARAVGEQAGQPRQSAAPAGFVAYGTPCQDMPDPLQCQIDLLTGKLQELEARLNQMHRADIMPAPSLDEKLVQLSDAPRVKIA